jgi:tetratricopeptide (TPR) repeat protein
VIALARGRFDEAAVAFAGLLKTSPADSDLRYGLVSARAAGGDYPGAWQAVLGAPADEPARAFDTTKALAAINTLVARDLRAAALCLRLIHHIGYLEEAADIGRQLLPALPPSAEFLGALATINLDLMRSTEAEALAARALVLDPAQADALVIQGLSSIGAGAIDNAQAAFSRAAAARPNSSRAASGSAMVDLLARRYAEAEAGFEQVLKGMPTHLGTWQALAWAQISQGNYAGAEATLKQALEINPNFSETHGSLAILAVLQGKPEEAREAMRRALGLDPGSLAGRFTQYLLLQKIAPQKASALLDKLLEQQAPDGRSLRQQLVTVMSGAAAKNAKKQ